MNISMIARKTTGIAKMANFLSRRNISLLFMCRFSELEIYELGVIKYSPDADTVDNEEIDRPPYDGRFIRQHVPYMAMPLDHMD